MRLLLLIRSMPTSRRSDRVDLIRLSWSPLYAFVVERWPDIAENNTALGAQLEVDRTRLIEYRRRGIPFFSADRIATRLGLHPSLIWGDDYYLTHLEVSDGDSVQCSS